MSRHRRSYRTLLLGLCLLLMQNLFCQQVTISGNAPFAPNEEIRVLLFRDLIQNTPEVAATGKIDKHGHFSLSCKLNQITLAQLAIRTTKAEMYLVPNVDYQLEIDVDTLLFNMLHPETYGGYLMVSNPKADSNDLNYKINRFDNYFGRAFDYYGFRITYDRDITAFDTISELLNSHFDIRYEPDNFYLSHLYYSYGMLEKICFPNDRTRIYNRYFNNDRILYNNPAYMALFTNYYTGYLYNSKYISKDLLSQTINEEPDYLTLFNEVGRDPMLVNERIRELVIIQNLIELFDHPEFDRGHIIKLLQYLDQITHFPEHKIYIQNGLKKMTQPNNTIQEVTFTNAKGRKESIKHLGDKPIYVQFFSADCLDCIREMAIMQELYKKYKDKIEFLSICTDTKESLYLRFMKDYGSMFEWPIWFVNGQYDWLMENDVVTLPDYLLLDKDGNVTLRRAPEPERELPEYLWTRFTPEEEQDNNPLFMRKNNN
ncbi:MAG: TlpA family protein disulfide reductase [Bacteroidales bacterium]|nr:TlpA family protein disulfide reductase [Bacteroidales bacterium]